MTTTPDGNPLLTEAEIIAHHLAGTLLPELKRPLDTTDQEVLQRRLAALHNGGNIDMLALVAGVEFEKLERRHLFGVQQIYGGVIPLLEAPTLGMLKAVQRLIDKGGNDGFAIVPRDAFGHWMRQNPVRAQEIVLIAQSDSSVDREVLQSALVITGDLSSVQSFLQVSDSRRQAAISALGTIKSQTPQGADEALTQLAAIAGADVDEDMRFTAIFAAFNLLHSCKEQASSWVPQLVGIVAAAPSDTTRIALLQSLWRRTELFGADEAKATLAIAVAGDLTSERLPGSLGATLHHLIGGVYHELAIDCLTELLGGNGKELALEQLQAVEHRLMALEPVKLFALFVRWFATGHHNLCESLSKMIGSIQRTQPFNDSLAGRGLSATEMVVLCHKAIGYLILAPIVAASFVVAALRANDRVAEPDLVQLLFQTVLINYGDSVVAYLEGLVKTDIAYRPVRKALKLYRAYWNGLENKIVIKELHPSSFQRGAVRQKYYIEGKELRKLAHSQSVLFQSVHRSTLLYGRKAITYVGGPDRPPVSMQMHRISAGVPMPRLQIIDPVGLDFLLRIFRTSKPQ